LSIIATVDSIYAPTDTQIAAAKEQRVGAWNGYLYFPKTWDASDVARIKAAGLQVICYANGNDDPAECKAMALAWGVRGCLDVERATRPFGDWTQAWLDASGFGIYASESGYPDVTAAFHIVALYPGHDPLASWPEGMSHPDTPLGWQWAGNVSNFGLNTDLSWFDSAVFGTITPPQPPIEDDDMPFLATAGVRAVGETEDPHGDGAVYVCNGLEKRWIASAEAASLSEFERQYGAVRDFSATPYVLDHMIELLPPFDATWPVNGVTSTVSPTPGPKPAPAPAASEEPAAEPEE
jgi:hypothetical protein